MTALDYGLSPPLIVGAELGKVITGAKFQGSTIEIRKDNRYKDGNIKIVKGVVRGNSKTVKITRATPPPNTENK